METRPSAPVHPLLAKFERVLLLTDAERAALRDVPFREEEYLTGDGVAWSGDRLRRVALVLDGILATSKPVAEGRIQVTNFHIAGDMPDLYALALERLDADVVTLTEARVAWIPHDALRRLDEAFPRLGRQLWRISLVEAAVSREWIVNVGRRDALGRVAHLFCELMARMEAAGLAEGGSCRLGLTQRDLTDATALSVVHVNRVIQELRGRGLVSFGQGRLSIHDRAALEALGDFRPDYLHLAETAGPGARA
jgi:CRP-like cAMP-binding protein